MYIPPAFRVDDLPTLHAFARRHFFATLVSVDAGGRPTAVRLPLLLTADDAPLGVLEGHTARANTQALEAVGESLAMFDGPHAYVSPTWYAAEDVVPTWNYAAVHAYGQLEIVDDPAAVLGMLGRLMEVVEGGRPVPWTMERSGAIAEKLLPGIVAFRLRIARWEGKFKLSQNHPLERRRRVAAALEADGGADEKEMGAMMGAMFPGPTATGGAVTSP
ncbi:MAG: FMN-binding negative transcriptional regulator [Planctomycetia bacterium]